jgi:hypothetical protein
VDGRQVDDGEAAHADADPIHSAEST